MRVADRPATASGTAETPKESNANFGSSFRAASLGVYVAHVVGVGRRARVGRPTPAEGIGQRAPAVLGIVGPNAHAPVAGRRGALDQGGVLHHLILQRQRRRQLVAEVD